MGSRWPVNVNGHNFQAVDPSGQSSGVNVPNASSNSASTSDPPTLISNFRNPYSTFVQSHHVSSATGSSAPSQVPRPRTQSSVQKPQVAPHPQLQPYSQYHAQPQTSGSSHGLHGPGFAGSHYGSASGQDPSAYRLPSESNILRDLVLVMTRTLESHSQKAAETFRPHFDSLHADISSLKTSFDQVREDVTKTREDIQVISEAQKRSDTATSKALRDFAEKAEALKAFLGETRLGSGNGGGKATVMGRLDEMYTALGEVIEKMADREADLPENDSNEFTDAINAPGHRTQAPTPSTDVDMADTGHPAANTSIQTTEDAASNGTSALNLLGTTNPDHGGMDFEGVGGSVPPLLDDLLEGVSQVQGTQGGEERPSTPINPLPQEVASNANTSARIDIYTRVSPVVSRNLNNAQPGLQGTPPTRLPALAIEHPNIPQPQQQQQQQPPTPISPVTSTYMHSLDTSITSITHSLPSNPLPHSLLDLNAAEGGLASSPPTSGGLLPELGYPTREPTVVPDSDDIDIEGHNDSILGKSGGEAEVEESRSSDNEDMNEDEGMGVEEGQSAANEVPEGGAELGLSGELEPEPSPEAPGVGIEQEVEAEMEVHEPEEPIKETMNEEMEGVEEQDEGLIQSDGEDHVQLGDSGLQLQLEDAARPGLLSEKEGAPISGATDSIVFGDAAPQELAEQDENEVSVVRRSKEPLFLPESRTGTISPLLAAQRDISIGDRIKEEEEEEEQEEEEEEQEEEEEEEEEETQLRQIEDGNEELEEQETSEHLLLSPEIGPSTAATTSSANFVPFAPPLSPPPQRQLSPELSEGDTSPSASPSPPTSPVIVKMLPIIDISQVIPSQLSQPQSSPGLSYADLPTEPEATSTPLATPAVISTSPEEAENVLAHLTTLSEPSSSEDEESEDEDEEEEQVDELLGSDPHPSPPPLPKKQPQHPLRKDLTLEEEESVQEMFTADNTVVAESSIQTFTPQNVPRGGDDSIRSFGIASPSPIRQTARKKTGGKSPRKRGEGETSQVLGEHRDEGNQKRTHANSTAVQPEPATREESGRSPPHLPPSPEPAPSITTDPPAAPTPPVQTGNPDTRNQHRAQKPVSPISLPGYISPINSPSPSRSPTAMRSFRSVFGTSASGSAFGRKRKLEEMRMKDGTSPRVRQRQQQQAQTLEPPTNSVTEVSQLDDAPMDVVEEREVLVRNTGITTTSGRSRPASPPVRTNPTSRPTSTKKKTSTPLSLRAAEPGGSSKEVRKQKRQREDSPIYVSSTPSSPTVENRKELENSKGKGKGRCSIDLTASPSPPRTQSPTVKARNMLNRSGVATTPKTNPRKSTGVIPGPRTPMANTKTKAQRERERKEEEERKEAAEREKREAERKRKREKEKKMLPIGTGDSDDAEIIPVKSYKKPQVISDEDDSGDCGGESVSANVTAAKMPKVDLSDILAKRKANEKASKALTKVKRKDRTNAPLAFMSIPKSGRSRNHGEPPLKKAKMRSADRDTIVSSRSTELKQSSRDQEERPAEKGEGKKGSHSGQNQYDPPSSPVRISWPVKKAGSRFDKNFVECDICKTWYHYGCVGIKMGDIRLKDSETFACPPCYCNRLRGTVSPEKNRASKGRTKGMDTCGRPDCGFKAIPDEDEYFVKRIIGKRVKHEGGRGRVEEWLVEWEGYTMDESTWQSETSMANPILLIESFNEAAAKEGWDLDEDPNTTVLLEDAVRAGFRSLT